MSNRTYHYVCYGCGGAYHETNPPYRCERCGEPLSIESDGILSREWLESPPRSMWHYFDLLPIAARDRVVSLEEGATPLVEAPRLAKRLGFSSLLLKNEMANPTGSFKDRQVSVGISHAREQGATTVAVVSSGNVACAAAAYAARAGMKAVLLLHDQAAPAKLAQAAAYGAIPVRIQTASARETFELSVQACQTLGWYHLSTAGLYEPLNVEGAKTIAYELFQQTQGDLPDWVVAPVGGGGLLGGIWRGFLDLQRLGLIMRLPRLAAVQATGCAPFVKAIEQGTRFLETLKNPWPNPKTVAGGIADDILFDGHTALPAVRRTDGAALAVDDEAILAAQRELAVAEGLLCEPTSAVVIAALPLLPETSASTRVCCVVTGSGMKDLSAIQATAPKPQAIKPSLESLDRIVRRAWQQSSRREA